MDAQASKKISETQETYENGWAAFDRMMHDEAKSRMEGYQAQWKIFDDLMQKQKEEFASVIKQQQEEIASLIKQQQEEIVAQNNNNSAFLQEIRQVAEVKPIMNELLQTSREQIKILSDLATSMKRSKSASNSSMPAKQKIEEPTKQSFFKRITSVFKQRSNKKQQ